MLFRPLVRASGAAAGILGTVWLFMFLLGQSFELGEGLEMATVALPVLAFTCLVVLHLVHRLAPLRWFLLDFSLASMVSFLVMQFVVARYVL